MSGYQTNADGSIGEILSTRFFPVMDLATNAQYWNGPYKIRNASRIAVTDFILASTPDSFEGVRNNNTPVLTECEIHWVVKKIASSIFHGHLVEDAVETLQFTSDLENPWDPVYSSLFVANYSMTIHDPHSLSGSTSTFGLDNVTAFEVFQVWEEIVPSSYILTSAGSVQKCAWAVDSRKIITEDYQSPWTPPNNITRHMANAVEAQNQVLRRNMNSRRGVSGQDVATGKAWKDVQVVKVEWAWITMPLTLLVLSGFFLAATVVRSSKEKIYKNSAIASLFSGLKDEKESEDREPRRGHLNTRAKNLRGSRLIVPGGQIHSGAIS